jgi:tetratricopeptide (TPR) repeat protein
MTPFMPDPRVPSVPWNERVKRLLESESTLSVSDPIAAVLMKPVLATIDDRPDDGAAVRHALLLGVHSLDERRAALGRLLAQIEQQEQLQAQWNRFDEPEWSKVVEQLEAGAPPGSCEAWFRWQGLFCEAAAAWRLDACENLLASRLADADPIVASSFARGFQALRCADASETLAWLDRLTAIDTAATDTPALEARRRLLVLKARLLLHDLGDADHAESTLALAARGATGSAAGLVDAARGDLLRSTGRSAEALVSFQDAAASTPALPDSCVGLGLLLVAEGSADEADEWFDRAVQRALMAPEPLWLLERLRAPICVRLLWKLAQALAPTDERRAQQAFQRACELPLGDANGGAEYELRATWRLQYDQAVEAAADLRAAASLRVAHDAAAAAALLERAATLDPTNQAIYWHRADALYLASYRSTPPYADAHTAQAALEAWCSGAALGAPRPPFGWAYLTRGAIAERQAWLYATQRESLLWQTVRWAEHSLLVDPGQAYGWSMLCRVHRGLENDECALEASRRATDLSPNDLIVLEERVIILVNTFRFDEASTMMARWRKLRGSGSWIDAVEAHVILNETQEAGRRERLERVLAMTETLEEPWAWMYRNRARAFLHLGRLEASTGEWERLLKAVDQPAAEDRNDVAMARMLCGQLDSALELLEQANRDEPSLGDATDRLAGLGYLLRGDLGEARQRLERGISQAVSRRALRNWTIETAPDVQRVLALRPGESAGARALLEAMLERARKKLDAMPASDTAIDELQDRLENRTHLFGAGTENRRGALTVLGRLLGDAGRFPEALACYQELRPDAPDLARLGIADTVRAWLDRGDSPSATVVDLLDADSAQLGIALHLRSALATASAARELRRGVGAATDIALSNARSRTAGGMPEAPQAAGDAVVAGGARELAAPPAIWRLDAALEEQADHDSSEPHRAVARAARAALPARLDESMGLAASRAATFGYLYRVTRIRLYLGPALLEQAGAESELMTKRWPDLQRRMLETTGIEPPQFHTQALSDDWSTNAYLIAFDDVPIAGGSDATGRWVASDGWKEVAPTPIGSGADGFGFMLRHLEALLRKRRIEFLGLPDVDRWLVRQREAMPPDLAPACDLIRGDLTRLQSLARLLRALAAEQVPLVRGAAIVSVFEANPGEGLDQMARRARQALREDLPGNEPGTVQVFLPEASETELLAWHVGERGRGYLAMPPEDTQELLAQVRSCMADVADVDARVVLVVRNPELRPPLWCVTSIEHPRLPVIAVEELLRPPAELATGLAPATPGPAGAGA